MPYHVVIRLPSGVDACADYRDPIAKTMHKINLALSECKRPDPVLYARVSEWLADNREKSALCNAGLSPDGPDCGHD